MKPGIILQTLRPTDHVDSAGHPGMLFKIHNPPSCTKITYKKVPDCVLIQGERKKIDTKFFVIVMLCRN